MKFKNYINSYSKSNRIYSDDDILKMPVGEAYKRKGEIIAQNKQIGIPSNDVLAASGNVIWVEEYTRDDGTKVSGHWRSKPGNGGLWNEGQSDVLNSALPPGTDIETEEEPSIVGLVVDFAVEIASIFIKDEEVMEIIKAAASVISTVLPRLFDGEGGGFLDKLLDEEEQAQEQTAPETENKPEENPAIEEQTEPEQEDLPESQEKDEDGGIPTGGAARIDRDKEPKNIEELPKNNDEFFEKERIDTDSWLMNVNADRNANNPDAKLFMDIALVHPKNVPSTQDYQFISSKNTKTLNEKYNLTGNKKIPSHYDGFEFSADSPTAKALNNSSELKNEIFNETKNYNPETGMFKSDKLEIEFKNDQNLQYSFGHMTVLDPKIENGYVTGIGFDKYDFDAMYGKRFKNVSQTTKDLNNSAKFLQSTTRLKNYFVFVPIRIKI